MKTRFSRRILLYFLWRRDFNCELTSMTLRCKSPTNSSVPASIIWLYWYNTKYSNLHFALVAIHCYLFKFCISSNFVKNLKETSSGWIVQEFFIIKRKIICIVTHSCKILFTYHIFYLNNIFVWEFLLQTFN